MLNIPHESPYIHCPILTSWFCFFYHHAPRVHFAADPLSPFNINNTVSYSLEEGVAQGDPLSSLLFVVTLAYILIGHRQRYPEAIRTTVIDDVCMSFAPAHSHLVPFALHDFYACLQQHNLTLNQIKTTIYCSGQFAFVTPHTFPYSLSHEGFSVCRVSVGSPDYCKADAELYCRKIADAETTFTRLHHALHISKTRGRCLIFVDLLRVCFRSRYSWALRTLTPILAGRVAVAADNALTRLLALSLPRHHIPPLPDEWLHLTRIHDIKLSLPLVKGGLGLRPWQSLTHIAHISSWIESGPRVLQLISLLQCALPLSISNDIGNDVAALAARFPKAPEDYWHMHPKNARHKLQHELTEWHF